MSHSSQPVFGAHGSTRKVAGSATMTTVGRALHLRHAEAAAGVNTGNTVRCEVSLASSVVVMVTPLRMRWRRLGRDQRLAAQNAVLIGEGEAHRLRACAA